MFDPKKFGKVMLKFFCIPSSSEPEIQGRIDQVGNFLFIKDAAGILDTVTGGKRLLAEHLIQTHRFGVRARKG